MHQTTSSPIWNLKPKPKSCVRKHSKNFNTVAQQKWPPLSFALDDFLDLLTEKFSLPENTAKKVVRLQWNFSLRLKRFFTPMEFFTSSCFQNRLNNFWQSNYGTTIALLSLQLANSRFLALEDNNVMKVPLFKRNEYLPRKLQPIAKPAETGMSSS